MVWPSPHGAIPFFFFNDTATTEIYTLSLHDALPISRASGGTWRRGTATASSRSVPCARAAPGAMSGRHAGTTRRARSEEHTSELQSLAYLVCRLLLEKKKNRLLFIFILSLAASHCPP